jgi:hypothetical protein
MTIWKYALAVKDRQDIDMPKGAKILAVQNQNGGGQLWALVNPKAKNVTRTFATFGTGHELPNNLHDEFKYVGTYLANPFVWHVFEVLP